MLALKASWQKILKKSFFSWRIFVFDPQRGAFKTPLNIGGGVF